MRSAQKSLLNLPDIHINLPKTAILRTGDNYYRRRVVNNISVFYSSGSIRIWIWHVFYELTWVKVYIDRVVLIVLGNCEPLGDAGSGSLRMDLQAFNMDPHPLLSASWLWIKSDRIFVWQILTGKIPTPKITCWPRWLLSETTATTPHHSLIFVSTNAPYRKLQM